MREEREEEEELLEELGYDEQSFSLKDAILLHLSFSLCQGSLNILRSPAHSSSTSLPSCFSAEPLVGVVFSWPRCRLDLRPRSRHVTFEVSLGDVRIEDHTDPLSLFPVLVRAKGSEVHLYMYMYMYVMYMYVCTKMDLWYFTTLLSL